MSAGKSNPREKIAIVLFNLGGPDCPEAVRPFLFNLFSDKSIIRIPNPMRTVLASVISRRRAKPAGEIYALLGGGSPLLPNTEMQAAALEQSLAHLGHVRVFIAMRYWHPMSPEAAMQVQEFGPDRVILAPLYPQFSTTTTGSSLRVWHEAARTVGLKAPTSVLCCYPTEDGFIESYARLIRQGYDEALPHGRPRVLFSSHGLPERIVRDGDPYQWQCEQTAAALVERLAIPELDWVSCYQSRVGPLKWIGPSTDDEIMRAGADAVPVVVAPIAFVSDHSETLVEIGMEYRHLAEEHGVPHFVRVPAVGVEPAFIGGLARLIEMVRDKEVPICSQNGGRLCPAGWRGCPQRQAKAAAAE